MTLICKYPKCRRKAISRGLCGKHYAKERLDQIRKQAWDPTRNTNKATLDADEAEGLRRLLLYRQAHNVWPTGSELMDATDRKDHPQIAAGLRKLLGRGFLRYSLYPVNRIDRLSMRALLVPKEAI